MSALTLLAQEIGTGERTLRRAVNEGTLRAHRPSPRKLELSLSERDYLRRQWSLLATLRSALRTEPNVRFALLFGSAASGTDTAESDVDLLLDLRDARLQRVLDLTTKLARLLGRDVDVVELADAEREPAFLAQLIAQGRVLVDREGIWSQLRDREAALRRRGDRQEAQRLRTALAGIDRLLAS